MSARGAWLSTVKEAQGLSEKQKALVASLADGRPMKDAWREAGYANELTARSTLGSHSVRLALDSAIRQRLASGTGAALSFLEAAFRGQIPNLPGGARVTAAIAWLDRAGFPVPRGEAIGKDSENKTLSEMTAAELRAVVADLKAMKADNGPAEGATLDDMLA
jgi:hypothetical protein